MRRAGKACAAPERANKDTVLSELCDVLGVARPNPKTGDNEKDAYVFERDAVFAREGDTHTIGNIDLYRAGTFILEAKQGSDQDSKKVGTAKRDTPAWYLSMTKAYGQALGYAPGLNNFEHVYKAIVTEWKLYDASSTAPVLIAEGNHA